MTILNARCVIALTILMRGVRAAAAFTTYSWACTCVLRGCVGDSAAHATPCRPSATRIHKRNRYK
jgi:hypothetical protein